MPQSFVIDIRHYLDEQGEVPALPLPAMTIAYFCGSVVAWVSAWPGPDGERTNLPCRRSRSRTSCWGEVYARLEPDDRIAWRCAACGEEGVISGWQGTRWDRSEGS